MKTTALITAFLAGNVAAFPNMDKMTAPLAARAYEEAQQLKKRAVDPPQGAGAMPLVPPPFDAKAQRISTTGAHKWVAPGPNDERGECPGLNALANHGYLPHNGKATITQYIDAVTSVYGMGVDLATFLATFGAVVDGNLLSWSVGGKPHTGIGGSHGNYEGDSSPLKGDLYQYGSIGKLVLSQFKELYDMQADAEQPNYNLDVLRDFRGKRFQESIDKNPKYVYGPFTGILVSQAAYTFIYRFMSNKSEEYPEGILDKNTLKSFMAISGSDDNPKWTFGHERIPDNWYKRNTADAYTIPYFNTDVLYFAETQPEILSVGCNQGKVDSFNAIDADTLSNGAYTANQAASNPVCFASEFAKAELPGLTGLGSVALAPLTKTLNGLTSGLNCASIGSVNTSALTACPGFSFYGGPNAKVAKGAIQS
ncbi:uncharacterized protein LTR77_010062 [Saxophila tyrrhenica]|uniref:Heme haloperoxidase family profile domain-containing protein n=1 Tax=Saxophila tyrrhenica TaxID=1690608 RepID=A0AAV9NX35_9PEZI|nr:hypothetical protein LTR77_010062 [Saxophila tyrrhenica]